MANGRRLIFRIVRFTSIRIAFLHFRKNAILMLVKRFYTKKWPPKCSSEASGGTLTDPGRAQEPSQERQKKNEIGPRGLQDGPRAENPGSKRGPIMFKWDPMPLMMMFFHIESEKILESIFGPFLTPKTGLFFLVFLYHFCIIFQKKLFKKIKK